MKPIRPIKTAKDHQEALRRVSELMDQADELEVLVLVIADYETKHCSIMPPDPIEAVKFRMEQQGLKQVDLVPFIGSRSRVSEVLSGKRELSLSMRQRLHKGLGIPATSLLGTAKDGGEA